MSKILYELDTFLTTHKEVKEYAIALKKAHKLELELKEQQLAILEKALELACRDAYEFIVLGEGCWFGACNEKNWNKFYELTNKKTDDDIATKLNCEYFKTKAKEMMKSE